METRDERHLRDLQTRAAWLYFIEGLTQDAVALKLGLTRQRVLKILAAARHDGTVNVRIISPHSECMALEQQLIAKFGLQKCIVIPAPVDDSRTAALLGAAVGMYVSETLQDDMTIGLGWGATLQASLSSITIRNTRQVTAVSLLGGLTRASGVNPSEFVWRFADLIGAESLMLAGPVYVPDEATCLVLKRHAGIADALARTSRLDMALLSVGNLAPNSTLVKCGLITRDELAEIRAAGAVADLLCQFVDAQGHLIDHPINKRVLAAYPQNLANTPNLVLASGGWQKVEAILAAIRLLKPNVLITDQAAAEGLLGDAEKLISQRSVVA